MTGELAEPPTMYAIILAGPPGSGKTTYANNHLPEHFMKLSMDDLIYREAARQKKTYEEVWAGYVSTADELLRQQIQHCNSRRLDFVLDLTNRSAKARKKRVDYIQANAIKIAIYFPAYTPEVLKARIQKRVSEGGHDVPEAVIRDMHKQYELPQKSEGFDLVVSSSHFLDIMKVMNFK